MSARGTLVVWALLAVLTLAAAVPNIQAPGLYYDEAFMAQQARDFAEPARLGSHPPSTRAVRLFGRSYPLRNAAYLGSLKSQLTIPPLAIFGSSVTVLRVTTLALGLLGLLFTMLWAERSFGRATAWIAGILVATDPSFYFFSQFEWGPFTTGLLCRSGGFLLWVAAWRRRSGPLFFAGGLALGLGVYNRVDFIVIVAAAGLALMAVQPRLLAEIRGMRLREAGAALAGFAIASATTLVALRDIFTTSTGIGGRGGVGYKAQVLWSVLDGSHFHRLMDVGGRFDVAFDGSSPAGLLGYASASAIVLAAFVAWRRPGLQRVRFGFLVLATLGIAVGMLVMPGAVRAHHMLNLMPFTQLLVAHLLARPWDAAIDEPASRRWNRIGAGLVLAVLVAANLQVIDATRELIRETGGKGRWSDSLQRFAEEIDTSPEVVVVSLDWGFHEPLQFTTDNARFFEAIWTISSLLQHGRPWVFEGNENHIYLVHEEPYDVFGLSASFLDAALRLVDEGVEVQTHTDRQGEAAFASIRIPASHRVIYTGEFSIELD